MEKKQPKFIEYMCSYCGHKATKAISAGRPAPGTCTRRGKNQPHRWIINRKM